MITQYIEQYLYQPEVFHKVAQVFPQAATGLPPNIGPQGLEQAVYELAKKAHYLRTRSAAVSEGLRHLSEISND